MSKDDGDMAGGGARSALVVEGGAMRGVFSAGVLDGFLDSGFDPFDLFIGVSAGACNLSSHLAGQRGRNHKIYTDYSCRPQFLGVGKFLRGGHLLDLDWLWEITIREIRLKLDVIVARPEPFLVTLTSVDTGKPVYLEPSVDDLEEMLKASSAMPWLYRGFPVIRGMKVTDGGVADSLPVMEAHRRGATRIAVVRSRPASYRKEDGLEAKAFAFAFRKRPGLVEAIRRRATTYNDAVEFIESPPDGVRVIQIAPPEAMDVGRTTRDPEKLQAGYDLGVAAAREATPAMEEMLAGPSLN